MTYPPANDETQPPTQDLTGRDRILRNTVISWTSQVVVIIAGFAMPRLMHETLGQTTLGIWDFAWTLVNYFNLMNLGIGSAVNRYIAKYRAEYRMDIVSSIVSTVTVIQIVVALVVVSLLTPLYFAIETYYSKNLGDELKVAQWVVTLLLLGTAVEMLINSARGVITGYHRWDIHNSLYAGFSIVSVFAMASVLLLGGGLVQVALAHFACIVLTETIRYFIARQIAADIELNLLSFSTRDARELIYFGAKTLLLAFPQVILVQSVNLVTIAALGPAALAIYARPFALMRHLYTMVYKFTMILTPTAGSLQSVQHREEIPEFFIATVQFNFALAVPAIVFFALFGDLLVTFWMGEEYRNWVLMAVLAGGHLLAIGQDAVIRIMQGLNMHGKLALFLAVTVVIAASGTYLVLDDGTWTLVDSAILLVVPTTLAFGMVVPAYSCYALGINPLSYILRVLLTPLLYNLPFIAGLLLARVFIEQGEWLWCGLALVLALILEGVVYYIYLLPEALKLRVQEFVGRARY